MGLAAPPGPGLEQANFEDGDDGGEDFHEEEEPFDEEMHSEEEEDEEEKDERPALRIDQSEHSPPNRRGGSPAYEQAQAPAGGI